MRLTTTWLHVVAAAPTTAAVIWLAERLAEGPIVIGQ